MHNKLILIFHFSLGESNLIRKTNRHLTWKYGKKKAKNEISKRLFEMGHKSHREKPVKKKFQMFSRTWKPSFSYLTSVDVSMHHRFVVQEMFMIAILIFESNLVWPVSWDEVFYAYQANIREMFCISNWKVAIIPII